MSTSDERQARPRGLTFLMKSQLLSAEDVSRALRRMAHEIVEHHHDLAELSIIGLQRGGEPFARTLAKGSPPRCRPMIDSSARSWWCSTISWAMRRRARDTSSALRSWLFIKNVRPRGRA